MGLSKTSVPVRCGAVCMTLLGVCIEARAAGLREPLRVNPDAALVNEFQKRVADYVKLHKAKAGQLPSLKPTDSPETLQKYKEALAHEIQAGRDQAKQGDIFTPPIAAEFRRLIKIAMRRTERAHRIRASLRRGEPVSLKLAVNGQYPSTVPLETTPATLLGNLPELPPEVEYRVVGRSLVLRDVTANLIVDFLPKAID